MTGRETALIEDAVRTGKLSGNGKYTQLCQQFFEERYRIGKCLLTTSCTDALEMCATLIGAGPGDEIIVPSFTFVSSANAFARVGAKVVFADCSAAYPNVDAKSISSLITTKTKAIVVVHYGGVACDMDEIMALAAQHKLFVIEDAAQAVEATYKGKPLGSIGHLATFSFHETKNIQCGEGGMLGLNHKPFFERAEIIWEKGTNRAAFFRGETAKYTWVDTGSSYLPSEITAAFLYGQLPELEAIHQKRLALWQHYFDALKVLAQNRFLELPQMPDYATPNGHLFYFQVCTAAIRNELLQTLAAAGINAVFHYLPLHLSPYHLANHEQTSLPVTERMAETLIRLPMYYELTAAQQDHVVSVILRYFASAEQAR